MGTHKTAGFTIIETMLFLAISGLLIVSLLIGVGASVNVQRYRDAAESFKGLLQEQYADLTSVENARTDSWSCGSTAVPSNAGPVYDNRGQSQCILIGKYVWVDNTDISVYTVIGYPKFTTPPLTSSDDITSLKTNYVLNVSSGEAQKSTLEWGTRISYPVKVNGTTNSTPATPRKLGFLVVRSPESGQIYTFVNNDPNVPNATNIGTATFTDLLVAGNAAPGNQGEQLICVDTNGLFASSDRGVYIGSFATGASAVEIRTNDYIKSISAANKATQC